MTPPKCYHKLKSYQQAAEYDCHTCPHFGDCIEHGENEMKKQYTHHAIKPENEVLPKELDNNWIEMMIAGSIGSQLALYSLTDPEGQQRKEMLKETIRGTMHNAYNRLSVDPKFDAMQFAMTARDVCVQAYSDFIAKRGAHCLLNGMPERNVIVKPN